MTNTLRLTTKLRQQLPAILSSLEAEAESRKQKRADMLRNLSQAQKTHERQDSELTGRMRPLESDIAARRSELQALEEKLFALSAEQGSARFTNVENVRLLKVALQSDAAPELRDFLSEIEALRSEVSGNFTLRQSVVLGSFAPGRPVQERVAAVLARTLTAYTAAERAAAVEIDVPAALEQLRAELIAEGIGFLEQRDAA